MTPPSQVYQEFDYIVQKYLGMQVWKVAFVEPQIIFLRQFSLGIFSSSQRKNYSSSSLSVLKTKTNKQKITFIFKMMWLLQITFH